MNDRIRELAEQATKHYPATESSGEFSTFDKEKFAELIVRECASLFPERCYYYSGPKTQQIIKQHFGVEE